MPGPQQEGSGIILDLVSGFEAQFSEPSISSGNPPSSTMNFTRTNARTESKVLAKQVVVPKDKRGPTRSREFGAHYSAATKALYHMFGAAKHFVPTSREGENDNPYHNTQEMYVGNLQKLRSVRDRATKYDMMDHLRIPVMIDSLTTEPADRWGDETTKRDVLTHWSSGRR